MRPWAPGVAALHLLKGVLRGAALQVGFKKGLTGLFESLSYCYHLACLMFKNNDLTCVVRTYVARMVGMFVCGCADMRAHVCTRASVTHMYACTCVCTGVMRVSTQCRRAHATCMYVCMGVRMHMRGCCVCLHGRKGSLTKFLAVREKGCEREVFSGRKEGSRSCSVEMPH